MITVDTIKIKLPFSVLGIRITTLKIEIVKVSIGTLLTLGAMDSGF